MSYPARFLARLHDVDDACVAAGGVPISPAWGRTIERYVRSGKRQIVVRKGRRIGASTIIAPRLAVTALLCSEHPLPPGEQSTFGFVSVKRPEARRRLRNVGAVLDALGIQYETRDEGIEPQGFGGRIFQTLTASFRTEVGQTIEWLWCDEVARWMDGDSLANPAEAVVSSLRPSLLTVEHAQLWLVSSPWGQDDLHARSYDDGETERQTTAFLPTAIGNPTLPEEKTRIEEPDPAVWSREYGAEPGKVVSAALDTTDVITAFNQRLSEYGRVFCCIDASSLVHDRFAWTFGRVEGEAEAEQISIFEVDAVEASERLTMGEVVARIATECKAHGVKYVHGDQREAAGLLSLFAQHDLTLRTYDWSAPSKGEAFQWLRRLLREQRLAIVEHDQLRREMLAVKARLAPSGQTLYSTNGLDFLSCLVTLAHAVAACDIRGAEPDFTIVGYSWSDWNDRSGGGMRIEIGEDGQSYLVDDDDDDEDDELEVGSGGFGFSF